MWQAPDKPPAWIDLRPASPRTEPAGPVDLALLSAIGPLDRAERLVFGTRFLGFYRVEARRTGPLLVRVRPAAERAAVEDRWRLERWLHEQGVATPEPLLPPTVSADGASILSGQRFVEHRLLRPEPEDLRRLGSALASLHKALSRHPSVNDWEERTRSRMARLESVRSDLAAGARAGPEPELLSRLAADRSLAFLPDGPRRPIHGDLNLGNVIADASGTVLLLDFEDVPHSVLSAAFDLALVVERFAMVPEPDAAAVRLARAFLSAYAEAGGDALPGGGVLWRTIRTLNLRSLSVLALLERGGVPQPDAEWRKFLSLSAMAEARAAVWKDLD